MDREAGLDAPPAVEPQAADPGDLRVNRIDARGPGPFAWAADRWDDDARPPAPSPAVVGRHRRSRVRIGVGAAVAVLVVGGLAVAAARGSADGLAPSADPVPSVTVAGGDATSEPAGLIAPTGATAATPATNSALATTPAAGRKAPGGADGKPSPTTVWTTLTVEATMVLRPGESVQTNRTRLLLQTDGDLVILDEFQAVRWRSNTAGHGDRAVFDEDGRLAVYDADDDPSWTTNTPRRSGAVLVLAADGNVNIMFHGARLWTSDTAH